METYSYTQKVCHLCPCTFLYLNNLATWIPLTWRTNPSVYLKPKSTYFVAPTTGVVIYALCCVLSTGRPHCYLYRPNNTNVVAPCAWCYWSMVIFVKRFSPCRLRCSLRIPQTFRGTILCVLLCSSLFFGTFVRTVHFTLLRRFPRTLPPSLSACIALRSWKHLIICTQIPPSRSWGKSYSFCLYLY